MTTKAPPDIVPVAMHQQCPSQKLELSEGKVTGLGGSSALMSHDAQPYVGLLNHQCYHRYHHHFLIDLTWSMDTSLPPSPMAAVRFAGSHSAMMEVICYLSFLHIEDLLLTILTS